MADQGTANSGLPLQLRLILKETICNLLTTQIMIQECHRRSPLVQLQLQDDSHQEWGPRTNSRNWRSHSATTAAPDRRWSWGATPSTICQDTATWHGSTSPSSRDWGSYCTSTANTGISHLATTADCITTSNATNCGIATTTGSRYSVTCRCSSWSTSQITSRKAQYVHLLLPWWCDRPFLTPFCCCNRLFCCSTSTRKLVGNSYWEPKHTQHLSALCYNPWYCKA